ncbi:hypothetical protein ST47_g1466 [Ascochyta rabiei]|uniref:DUF6536 domain-containing protein n=1 Tax=Didymella rabiei TaxID=5454 RepID=A0A163L0D7_DIDRA|nr:hypothetical protein ST47_g1466 [Ascochyta rabiei]
MKPTITFELQSLRSDTPVIHKYGPEKRSWLPLYRFTGWRSGVLNFAGCATLVCVINLIVTIWSSSTRPTNKGLLYQGDCDHAKKLSTGLHCLSAPTRSEVDRAHANNKWLDIGIPSMRNLKYIKRHRLVLWILLAFTSLPLHLFYNSAVYVSVSSNSYFAFSVSESFLESAECINCSTPPNKDTNLTEPLIAPYPNQEFPYLLNGLWSKARNGTLDRLEPAECIDQYATLIQSTRRNVLLVASDENFPGKERNTFINGSYVYDALAFASIDIYRPEQASNAYKWLCSGLPSSEAPCTSRISDIKSDFSAWRVGRDNCSSTQYSRNMYSEGCNREDHDTYAVSYCLSEEAIPHCKVHFSRDISILVTVINLAKALLMFYVAFKVADDPLITMGDAVASFIDNPDPSTSGACLASIAEIRKKQYRPGAKQWRSTKVLWRHATSKMRRTFIITTITIVLSTVSSLLGFGISKLPNGMSRSFAGLASLGFGAVDPRAMIASGLGITDLISNSLIANSPQLVLSISYFMYNACFTNMLLGYEWLSYAQKRKGLRLSRSPTGEQRSTYFLQLPYRFGIPLVILSGTLHWLVSQSIFLVSIDLYDYMDNKSVAGQDWLRYSVGWEEDRPLSITTCGYSPIAIIFALFIGSLMLVALLGVGFIPYKHSMPLAGSCSMAISAACHPEVSDREQLSTQKLQWGVETAVRDHEGVGHCSFSASPVGSPVEGHTYA